MAVTYSLNIDRTYKHLGPTVVPVPLMTQNSMRVYSPEERDFCISQYNGRKCDLKLSTKIDLIATDSEGPTTTVVRSKSIDRDVDGVFMYINASTTLSRTISRGESLFRFRDVLPSASVTVNTSLDFVYDWLTPYIPSTQSINDVIVYRAACNLTLPVYTPSTTSPLGAIIGCEIIHGNMANPIALPATGSESMFTGKTGAIYGWEIIV